MRIHIRLFVAVLTVFFWGSSCKKDVSPELRQANGSCSDCHASRETLPVHPGSVFLTCSACHKGNAAEFTEDLAHAGMIPVPGSDLSNPSDPCFTCHIAQKERVLLSPMFAAKQIFQKAEHVFHKPGIYASGEKSLSGSYTATLCSDCHLDSKKRPTVERGCLACHRDTVQEGAHSTIVGIPEDSACANCHDGSARISLTYRGLAETFYSEMGKNNRLESKRGRTEIPPDIHFTAGFSCVDCHTSGGVMGNGKVHASKSEAVMISCEDCHDAKSASPFAKKSGEAMEQISSKSGNPVLSLKSGKGKRPIPRINRDSFSHQQEHETLSCDSCHSQGVPSCTGCHIREEDVSGTKRWIEYRGESRFLPAVLGHDGERIRPFLPGMKLTVEAKRGQLVHSNLFAPVSPHSVGKKARECQECHFSPRALGYGNGQLLKDGHSILFVPEYQVEKFGPYGKLPLDGWIRPLENVTSSPLPHTLSPSASPLTPAEQRAILTAGICLNCHSDESFFRNFAKKLNSLPTDRDHHRILPTGIETAQEETPGMQ